MNAAFALALTRPLAHPWIAQAVVHPAGVLAQLSAEGLMQLRQHGRQFVTRQLDAVMAETGSTMPMQWRLVDVWPAGHASQVLAQPRPTEAVVQGCVRDGDRCELSLHLPPDLSWFADHFETLPVLPGVVQLQWALSQAARQLGTPSTCRQLEKLKFQRLLRPGDDVTLQLTWQATRQRLQFAYVSDAGECASGRFVWGPA